MDDLFALFPDLPWARRRPLAERLRELRTRAIRARRRNEERVSVGKMRAAILRRAWEARRRGLRR
jgi:hypothetical protein